MEHICFQNFWFEKSWNHIIKQEKLSPSVFVPVCFNQNLLIFWLPGLLASMLKGILSSGRRKERTKLEPGKSGSIAFPEANRFAKP